MKPRLPPLVRRVAVREWCALVAVLVLLALVLGWQNGLGRWDQTLYDQFVTANDRPARDDIIIVAIDDFSLSELGRWPWPRGMHAELLTRLQQARPRAIGMDVILTEPEQTNAFGLRTGDTALALALKQSRRTVLPLITANRGTGLSAMLPIPELADAALAVAHINLEHDSDGVVRSVFLREGQDGVWWPHFGLALFNRDRPTLPMAPASAALTNPKPQSNVGANGPWQRTQKVLIPFAGKSGHYRTVPYVAVLRGEVPAQFFSDKYVLVGATAVGMGDAYPTPVSADAGAMPGIEINANVLASLLDGKTLVAAEAWQSALFSVLPLLLAMFGYFVYSPRTALFINLGLVLATFAASFVMFRAGIWMPPAAALIVLVLSYPLWSWRRLEAAIHYLGQEFIRLDREPHLLPEDYRANEQIEDVLEQRINAMRNAARRVRDLRQFVSDSLNSLPDATLVATTDGHVLLANQHAKDYFASIGFTDVTSALLPYLFSTLPAPQPLEQVYDSKFDWWNLLELKHVETLAHGVSVQDQRGRDLLVKSAPSRSAANVLTGWIISIIDISAIRSAERSRDETLRFLSHDMRAPQASILALLELQEEPSSALPQTELFSRIDKAARKTLGLADNFVQLARAESHEYRFEEVDFQDLLIDAIDEMWSLAQNKQITLVTDIADGDYPVSVDRSLMTRALVNLLSNAINYSPENRKVTCSLRYHDDFTAPKIQCRISDQGYGIAAADQIKLFQRFQRVDVPDQPRHDGIGLGLVFVKTVIERHTGQIGFSSKVGVGTVFTITLPCFEELVMPVQVQRAAG